nr:protein NRT1/ PTR FAMILY 5.10-like [Ipomoea batatas]
MSASEVTVAEDPLLPNAIVEHAVDYKGRPVGRASSGGWRSASFIIGKCGSCGEVCILRNQFQPNHLPDGAAGSMENVNAWSGMAMLLPLLGAFVADSFLGRFRTIIVSSLLYILGLAFLTLSAVLPFSNSDCQTGADIKACSPPQLQIIFFFFALYLVALAQGGHKPCVQAFGADQFDVHDSRECKQKSSFFNWWYFGICFGAFVTILVMSYIQDNLSWGLGFGIPCIVMVLALIIFLLGTKTYRFSANHKMENPFMRIGKVFVKAVKNWWIPQSVICIEEESHGIPPCSLQYRFLNKALLAPNDSQDGEVCTINNVEEAKAVLSLVPIWISCLVYGIVYSQSETLFTKQGFTMDRSIGTNLEVPAAALQCFIAFTSLFLVPFYDCIFVPFTRAISGKPSGITTLQRVGVGLFLSIVTMVIAALVETRRLRVAQAYQLVDLPEATVPMSVCWLIPQYVLYGIFELFASIGMQEFFYDQVPNDLKSIGLALFLSVFGVGSFLSSLLISVIQKATINGEGSEGWISDNLNKGHLDYFYWLLALLSTVAFAVYLYFSRSYMYSQKWAS